MLYGVISDIHSNIEALNSVLDVLKNRNVEGYICCGDIVGYGPNPEECVETVSALPGLLCVSGNHDLGVAGTLSLKWFNTYARESIEHTWKEMSVRSLRYLSLLPKLIKHDNFTLVHGSPRYPAEEYMLTPEQYLENADRWKTPVCFIGHSHLSVYFSQNGVRFPEISFLCEGKKLVLETDKRYMINPGSIGQPRDKNPKASCGIYDTSGSFEIIRVEYDITATREAMKKKNLAPILIERLGLGC